MKRDGNCNDDLQWGIHGEIYIYAVLLDWKLIASSVLNEEKCIVFVLQSISNLCAVLSQNFD